MIFKHQQEKYHPRTAKSGVVFGVPFWSLRRGDGVPFLVVGVVFGLFLESKCFSSPPLSRERVCKKGSNTTPKGKIPPQPVFALGVA